MDRAPVREEGGGKKKEHEEEEEEEEEEEAEEEEKEGERERIERVEGREGLGGGMALSRQGVETVPP